MSEPDDLFTLRNHYWLGSYQLAIAEGSGLGRLPEALRVERDEFIYRSYLALGQYSIVLGEVGLCANMWSLLRGRCSGGGVPLLVCVSLSRTLSWKVL